MLKCLLAICICIGYLEARPVNPYELQVIHAACSHKTKVDPQIVANVYALSFTEDEKYKKYLFCTYVAQGYQSIDGKFNYSTIKEFLKQFYTEADTDLIVDSCKGIHAKTREDSTYQTMRCMINSILKLGEASKGDNEI